MASMELPAGSGSSLWLADLFSIYSLLHILKWFTQEGAFTSTFGLATLFFVLASPRTIRLLTEEREVYCQDLADNWSGDADTDGKYDEVFSWSEVASVFTDAPHVLLMAIPLFFSGVTVTVSHVL